MSKISITGRRVLMFLPGLLAGILVGLLVTVPHVRLASAPAGFDPAFRHANIESLTASELEKLALESLSTLREKRRFAAGPRHGAGNLYGAETTNSWAQVQLGLKNIRRLLPLAKLLTLDALRAAQPDGHLKGSGLLEEKRLLQGVRRIVLDEQLDDAAEIWDDRLSEIRIAVDYAPALISDDEAIFLLAHELTHVAVRSGRLKGFIDHVKETATRAAHVEPTREQKEDLACDYNGAQVLRRFIAMYPTGETERERFYRISGFESSSQRLAFAWEDFCATYNGASGDEEHLSQAQTMRALAGLDPELKALVPDDALPANFCR